MEPRWIFQCVPASELLDNRNLGSKANLLLQSGNKTSSSYLCVGIASVCHPTECLKQCCRAQVVVITRPPIARASSWAAGAQYALVETVKLLTLGRILKNFLILTTWFNTRFEPRFDRLDLLVKVAEVRNQIFDNSHVRKWENPNNSELIIRYTSLL